MSVLQPGISDNVFLSLIITTYKRNEWLKECLASIQESVAEYRSKGGLQNIEIVVTDDDTAQQVGVLDEFIEKFGHLNVIFSHNINTVNLGDYFNRNNGISLSKGDWVKFIDDDDIIYPWSISFMIDKLEESANANTVIFYLRDGFRHLKFPVELKQNEVFDFHYLKFGLFHCSLVSAVFRRSDLNKVGCFKFKRFYGDFQIFHDMALQGTFKIYPIELGWYRVHEMQESNFNRRNARIVFNYHLFTFNFFLKNGNGNDYLLSIKKYCTATVKYAIKTFDWFLFRQALQLLRYINIEIKGSDTDKARLRSHWETYYRQQIVFSNNELVAH